MTATPHPDTPGIINQIRNQVQNNELYGGRALVPSINTSACAECGAAHEPAAPHVSCPLCDHVHPAPTRNDWFRADAGGVVDRRVHPEHIACPTCGEYHTHTQRHGECSTCSEAHPQGTPHPTENRQCPHCGDYAEHGADQETADEYHENDWGDLDGWDDAETPRSEEQLVQQEPNRVAGIQNRLNAVVKMHDSRVHDSNYFVRSVPSGTYRGQWGYHTVLAYHKNDPETAIGHLTYDDKGEVGGMYISDQHQKGLAAVQMLVAAHRHLKDTVGNPIGLLRSSSTTADSAGLIRKIDPDSTYLRQPNANGPRQYGVHINHEGTWNAIPISADSLVRPQQEMHDLAEKHGYTVAEALAMSYDPDNRSMARSPYLWNDEGRFDQIRPEVRAIHDRLEAAQQGPVRARQQQTEEKNQNLRNQRFADRLLRVPGDIPIDEDIHGAQPYERRDENGNRVNAITLGSGSQDTQRARSSDAQALNNERNDRALRAGITIGGTMEAATDNQDLVGTAGVWTGDDEIEDKKSPSRAEVEEKRTGLVPLDLNPVERVRRLTRPGRHGNTIAYRRAED